MGKESLHVFSMDTSKIISFPLLVESAAVEPIDKEGRQHGLRVFLARPPGHCCSQLLLVVLSDYLSFLQGSWEM
jgi:hypothetical protein